MRILFLSGLYPPETKGGAELSTHYIAQGLQARGHTVQVITSTIGTRREDSIDGIPVVRAPLTLTAKPLFEKRWAKAVAKKLAAELDRLGEFDIVHCHDFRSAQVVSQLNLKNAVVTVRDYAFICGSPNNLMADGSLCPGCEKLLTVFKNRAVVEAPPLRRPFRVWQYWHNIGFRKESLAYFRHRIYISAAQQAIVHERLNAAPMHEAVIYNPVPPAYFSERPMRTVGQTILFVGTLESYKGVDLLLEAFAQLRTKWPDVQLKVVGEGAQRAKYEQWVARRGLQYQVSFAGRVPYGRMRTVYDEALVVVAPHLWPEPFGRTVVEAMARERLVVVAKTGGPAEIVQDGITGFLFEAHSAASLQVALDRALSCAEIDRREIQRAARQWTADHVTITQIAQQHETFYNTVRSGAEQLS